MIAGSNINVRPPSLLQSSLQIPLHCSPSDLMKSQWESEGEISLIHPTKSLTVPPSYNTILVSLHKNSTESAALHFLHDKVPTDALEYLSVCFAVLHYRLHILPLTKEYSKQNHPIFIYKPYPRLYPILFYTHSWYICEKHSTVPWAKIKTELVLLTTINIENTQVQKKTEYTTQNSTLQQWWVHYGMAIMAVMAIMAIAEKVPVTAIEWMQWQYFLGWLDGTLISSKWNKLTNHTNVGGVVS